MDKFFVNRLAAIYVPSEKTRQQVRERYGRDATVIRIGIDVKFFEGGHDTILAGELGIENRFVLLTVGKLHPQKNQIVCIEAMSRVLQYIPNVVLVLAGEGPMMQEWKEIAERLGVSQNVLFLGQVNSLKIRDLYKVCDVNLFLPINQSWGFTPFEALCADKISIVSDDCGASEVLSKEEIGLVCQPTSEDLAENILKVHEKSAFYKEAATRGHRYVSKHLTWERYSEAFLMVVRKATEPSQRIVVEEGAGGERIP
jgi:glycosyltransferase involved in cell wall biosynthesis